MGEKPAKIQRIFFYGMILGLMFPTSALLAGPMSPTFSKVNPPQSAMIPLNIPKELFQKGVSVPNQLPNAGFIENEGQVEGDCQYYLNLGEMIVYFCTSQVKFFDLAMEDGSSDLSVSAFSVKYLGATMVSPIGIDVNSNTVNFLTGVGSWTDVSSYNKVQYPSIYPGIDLQYFLTEQGLKYEFIVHAGADPLQIKIAIEGSGVLNVLPSLVTSEGSFSDQGLFAYQAAGKIIVDASFTADPMEASYGFNLESYDKTEDLVIDPLVIDFSTYLGGSLDEGRGATVGPENGLYVDDLGNIYVTGITLSTNFPVSGNLSGYKGNWDIFVTKFNPDASALIYSTYIGGSMNDHIGAGITVDSQGNAYVVGSTYSSDFPTVNPYQTDPDGTSFQDIVAFKLNSTGNGLIYSTYLGGTAQEAGQGLAINNGGNLYITGYSSSSNYPLKNPYQGYDGSCSAVITELNATGNGLIFSTYFGGSLPSEYGEGIALDASGNIFICGDMEVYSTGSNFPLKNPWDSTAPANYVEGFVACFNSTGNGLNFSTYIGGSSNDAVRDIKLGSDGCIYVVGTTESTTDFPLVNAYQGSFGGGTFDAFVVKLNSTGNGAIFSTYLGGNGADMGWDLSLTSENDIVLVGNTTSTNLVPVQALQNNYQGGSSDVFVTMLSTNGTSMEFNSYLGGNGGDYPYDVWVDPNNCTYIFGETSSTNFPTINAYQNDMGGKDAFLTKIFLNDAPLITGSNDFSYYVNTTGHVINWTIVDDTVSLSANYTVFRNGSVWGSYNQLSWTSGMVNQVDVDGLPVGIHNFSIWAFDGKGCKTTDEVCVTVLKRTTNGTWQDINLNNQFITCFDMEVTFAEMSLKGVMTGSHINITAYTFNPTHVAITNGVIFFKIELDNYNAVNFPVTVNFYYDDNQIPHSVSEGSLGIYHLVNDQWILQGGTINTKSNSITLVCNSFSAFAIAPISENNLRFDPVMLGSLIATITAILVAYGCIRSRKGKGKNIPEDFGALDFDP